MTDLDPEIWKNKTLGAATNGVFLDVVEKQQAENRSAAIEGRPARIVKREDRYPGFVPENPNDPSVTFGSSYEDGSRVVPVLPAPEEGYDLFDDGDAKPEQTKSETAKVSEKAPAKGSGK